MDNRAGCATERRRGLLSADEVTLEGTFKWGKGGSEVYGDLEEECLSSQKSMCKGPGAGVCLVY